LDLSRV